MPEPVMKFWGSHYRCYWCAKDGNKQEPATIRVFSGIGGGGWPDCGEHEQKAIEKALRSLFVGLVGNYSIKAYRVGVDEEGWPMMTELLFTARRRDHVEGRADG